ncbi:LGFP repeat-containing protein, partial [Bifidobacterium boum]
MAPMSPAYAADTTTPAQQQPTSESPEADHNQPTDTDPNQPADTDPSDGAIDAYATAHTWLGAPTAEITAVTTVNDGAMRTYQHGAVYWSANTKVHSVASNIDSCYQKHLQDLGFPVNDGMKLNGGASQAFQYGQIHWSPSTGAHFT